MRLSDARSRTGSSSSCPPPAAPRSAAIPILSRLIPARSFTRDSSARSAEVPCFSALVPDGMAIITDRNAVKFFVKREASLEQDRDIETKINTVVYERCGLIALVDDTSTVILGKKAADITASVSSGTLTVSGKKTSSDDIYWRKADFAALGGEDVSSWNKWDGSSKLDAAAGERISVAEAGTDGLCVASAVVTAA